MGSQAIQGHLWGQRSKEWADIQEKTGNDGYTYVLNLPEVNASTELLDVGCGSGLFSSLAYEKGVKVTGIDASERMIEQAKQRNVEVNFLTGEMENLSFVDDAFDIVCGFNSFQYAADVKNALQEVKRVLKSHGRVIAMIWGNREECEAATYLKAVASLLPPPPSGAPGPFALSENEVLENLLKEVGFTIVKKEDITAIWDYENKEIALKGLMSAGPVAKAIENSSFDKVYETISSAIIPYTRANGNVVYHNKYRIIIAEK